MTLVTRIRLKTSLFNQITRERESRRRENESRLDRWERPAFSVFILSIRGNEMRVSKELFEIARAAEEKPSGRSAIDCIQFSTDGIRNEAAATDGRCAIIVKWPALEETEGAEIYLIPASDCLQIKPGIKRVMKQATASISDSDDGFTLFEQFNEIGSVFRSPKTNNRFPNVNGLIEDELEYDIQSYPFNISRLARLFCIIEKLIGGAENVSLSFREHTSGGATLIIRHSETKLVDAILLGTTP